MNAGPAPLAPHETAVSLDTRGMASRPQFPERSDGRPKIAFVLPRHWATFMGGSQFQAKLLTEALNRAAPVDIVYLARDGNPADSTPGCRVRPFGVSREPGRGGLLSSLRELRALWRILREEAPDLIYQRVGCGYTGLCARYARSFDIPMVWHVANVRDCRRMRSVTQIRKPREWLDRSLLGYGIKAASQIVAQTTDQAELLLRNYRREPDVVIANFHPPIQESRKPEGRLEVAWVANLKPMKRPELLLDIAEQFRNDNGIHFTVIGAPYQRSDLRARFQSRAGALGNLSYRGLLSQDEVNATLARSHILLSTSQAEGLSNTFVQAWLSGARVMTIGINPEGWLDDARLGGCFDTADELAAALRRTMAAETGLQDADFVRSWAQQQFSMSNADELARLLLSEAGKAGRHREALQS